jgi:hypothetical protein
MNNYAGYGAGGADVAVRTAEQPREGTLAVAVASDSNFLSRNLPYEVRDARHRLVDSGVCGTSTQLPQGLYSVSVLTPTGQLETQLAQISAGVTTPLSFAGPAEEVFGWAEPEYEAGAGHYRVGGEPIEGPSSSGSQGPLLPSEWESWAVGDENLVGEQPRDEREEPTLGLEGPLGRPARRHDPEGYPHPSSASHNLVSMANCTVNAEDAAGWEFVPLEAIGTVPHVTVDIEGTHWTTSLPLNPQAAYPLSSCRVDLVSAGGRTVPRVVFASARRVSNMVLGLVEHHELITGTSILDEATELLAAKYADPPGAVLAGLTLHRLGWLEPRTSWVERLADTFSWIPDAVALMAAVHSVNPDRAQRRAVLGRLLEVAFRRPMYTDGLSLTLELLRRWPDEEDRVDDRKKCIEHLTDFVVTADLDAVALTVSDDEGGWS